MKMQIDSQNATVPVRRTRRATAFLSLLFAFALTLQPASAQPVIYVDADAVGAADGTSWSDAFNQLNRALDAAGSAAQIWVAEGTYRPTTGSNRQATFILKNNVTLYGGFQGDETTRDQRNPDPATNGTILSGNIGSEDEADDNSYHVVSAIGVDDTAVLDGFTITAGYADGPPPHERGAGLTNYDGITVVADTEGFPVLRNVRFVGNETVGAGGGVYLNSTLQPTRIEDASFEDNDAAFGGALYANGEVDIERATFTGNAAANDGGALWLFGSSEVEMEEVTFEENTAVDSGGAVYARGELEIEDGVFIENEVTDGPGGAVYSAVNDLYLVGVRFVGNEAEEQGGAIAASNSDLVLLQAYLADNDARVGGGLWCGGGSNCDVTNAVFVGGEADEEGGAIHSESSRVYLTNATITANDNGGYTSGGAMSSGFSQLRNSIFWDNGDLEIETGAAQVISCIVEGGYENGTSILAEDPLFVRAPFTDGDDDFGDLRLLTGSPAVDFGANNFLPQDDFDLDDDEITGESLPLDLDGSVRVEGGSVDLGAYEGDTAVAIEDVEERPVSHVLQQNYPNPFNPATTIRFVLAEPSHVTLRVFDVLGREVARLEDGRRMAGAHTVRFDASDLSAGVYFYRLEAGTQRFTRTMTLVE